MFDRCVGEARGRLVRELSCAALSCAVLFGCAGNEARRYDRMRAAYRDSAGAEAVAEPEYDALPFPADAPLEREALVREVLRRSPDIEAARQAWRANLVRYPQASAFQDPMLEYEFAPMSIGADGMPFGQSIELSQKFAWPGKRGLEGQVVLAEAEAAHHDFEAVKRSLAAMTAGLFDAYYAATRSLEVNAAHAALVTQIRQAVEGQYTAGGAGQQELLQMQLEQAQVERERLMLQARRAEVVAELNGLLRRAPERPLPEPPATLEPTFDAPPTPQALRDEALHNRSELASAALEIEARAAEVDLARRDRYPELGVMTSYNTMWADQEHRWMLGMSLSLPLQVGARNAAAEQAAAERAGAEANLAAETNQVSVEVERARQAVLESQGVAQLYRGRLLPTARAQIEAAQIGYSTGRGSLQGLIDAQRSLRSLELGEQEQLAELGRRWAELERALGRIAGLTATKEVTP